MKLVFDVICLKVLPLAGCEKIKPLYLHDKDEAV
jgi:predicted small lipoprotein YifL